jgi:hypothetical protein
VEDSHRAGKAISSFRRSKVFKNYLGQSAAESCTRAINLTVAFTTHFPEGLRAIPSEEYPDAPSKQSA